MRVAPGITKVSPLDFDDYPISHGLLTTWGWSILIGSAYVGVRRYAPGAWIVGFAVLSHWVLDWIVHRPDLPLWPGGPRTGLGLRNSWPASVSLELLTFVPGLWSTCALPVPATPSAATLFWSLMALLFFGRVSTLFAGAPPSEKSLALGALGMWFAVPWGCWVDRHRVTTSHLSDCDSA